MEDQAKGSTNTFEIDTKNYAADQELADKAASFLKNVVYDAVTNRRILDEQYISWYNIYKLIFDKRFYNGRSATYIPLLRRVIENAESRLMKALFPTDDLFYVEPGDPENDQFTSVVDKFIDWQLDHKIHLKQQMPRFVRQFLMYGWSPVKIVWEREVKEVRGLEKVSVPKTKRIWDEPSQQYQKVETGEFETRVNEVVKKLYVKNNPTFQPVDIFHFYVYPVTANDIGEVFGCFEFIRKPLQEVKLQGKVAPDETEPDYVNTDQVNASNNPFPFTLQWSAETRLATQGISNIAPKMAEIPMATLIEYWGKFNFGTEDSPDFQEAVLTFSEDWVALQIRKNPFYDQEKPYLVARMTQLENEFYSDGYIAPLAPLQYYYNDVMNQVFDGLWYTLNPIIKYDPGRVVNINSIAFTPGAMWALSDPAAAVLEAPKDVSTPGFNAANLIAGIVEQYPGLQPMPMAGRKAATHISAIQQEYSLPIMDMAENMEAQVMSPWLKKVFLLNQQFVDENEVFFVVGKDGKKYWQKLSPEMLVGDYNFKWNGSNQATNVHVRAQQMMQFVNILTPLAPYLQQQGNKVNITYLLKRIWKEGFGLNGEDQLVGEAAESRAIDPNIENLALGAGHYLGVDPQDDDEQHIQVHQAVQNIPLGQKHIQAHQQQMQQKQLMQQAQTSQVASNAGQPMGQEQMLEATQPPGPGGGNPSGEAMGGGF